MVDRLVWRCLVGPAPMELAPVGGICTLPCRLCQHACTRPVSGTRDVPWVSFLLLGTGLAFLFVGLRRAFGQPQQYRGRIAGPILGALSVLFVALLCFVVFYQTRQLPASPGAPKVGERAPEFVLPDMSNPPVSPSSLLFTPFMNSQMPPKGVVLVFYRGYW